MHSKSELCVCVCVCVCAPPPSRAPPSSPIPPPPLSLSFSRTHAHAPPCSRPQTIPGKKNKCTHIVFNAAAPILIVGDILGGVTSAKLSPNLRKIVPIPMPPARKGEAPPPPPSRLEVEIRKLDTILAQSNSRISIVTPVPGIKEKAAEAVAEGAEAGAE